MRHRSAPDGEKPGFFKKPGFLFFDVRRLIRIAPVLLSVVVLTSPAAFAEEAVWAAPEATFSVNGSTITASDGGKSQGDHYLLSAADLRACVLDFDLIRVANRGPRERALLVFNVDFSNRNNRSSLFLPAQDLPVGKRVHYRLAVLGYRAELYRDGARTGPLPQPNGRPKSPGRVGFLHYYDYDYRYENARLASLEAETLPQAGNLKADLLRSGGVRLTWTAPELYQDLVMFRVHRSEGADCPVGPLNVMALSESSSSLDLRTRAKRTYSYRVCTIGPDGRTGPASDAARVEITSVEPPAPPSEFHAVRRLDGSARLSWRMSPESRAASLDLFASARAMTPADLKDAKPFAAKLSPRDGAYLAPPSEAVFYALRVNDPDDASPAFVCKESAPTAPPVPAVGRGLAEGGPAFGEGSLRGRAGAPFPAKHPYLYFTVDDILAAREKIRKEEWAQRAYKDMLSSADAICKKGLSMPPVTADYQPHHSLSNSLLRLAQAYALSGDEKYAAYVKDALLLYADMYPKLPVKNHRSRVTPYSLMEATWYEPLILAYDYIYESPNFAVAEKERVEQDLLRPACALFKVDDYAHDPRGSDLHFKCYNFQAWFIGCTGLTGLCLRDPDLLEYAIDGPYGLKHLVTHDIRDDGLFWERSLGYHQFVMHALQPFLEAAWHCNLDLYHMQVPDDLLKDRENIANYVVDGDNGPKTIKLLYDGPFYFTFPDLTFPVYADSGRGPLTASDFYRIAWLRYRDPKYAWLILRPPAAPPAQWKGPQDASAKVWLSWDDSSLYVCADVKDDVVRNTHTDPAKWWNGDGLWLALKFTDNPEKVYDFIYFIDPGDFGKVKPVLALFNRYGAARNGVSAGQLSVKKTPDGYEARAIIPISEIAPKAGESGTPLRPREGMKITFDACLYDGDRASGDSVKEKMLAWASATDRYNTDEGGALLFGEAAARHTAQPRAAVPHAVAVRAARPLTLDGSPDEWRTSPTPIAIDNPKHLMYDRPSAPPGQSLFYDRPSPRDAHFEIGTGRFANNGVAMNGSTLFPSSGFAILRSNERHEDAACVALSYGPHGGGHGHSDMLSIVLYAFGKHVIPDFGSCPYESKEKGQWTAQTVSHNTVVVDETSQYPTGSRDVTWPCDTAVKQAKGALDYFHAGPLLKVVRARSAAVYEGVELVRTVALFDHNVLDVFDVSSAGEHTYDYVLHIDGETRLEGPASGVPLKFRQEEGPLGSKCGYQWITGVRRTATDGLLAFSTAPPDAPQWVTVNLLPEKGTEAILADGITNRVDKKTPVFIARRKGKSTRFVGVFCPGSRVMQVGPPVIRKAGDSSFVSEDWNHHEAYLFLPPAPAETTWGPFSCAALAAAFRQGFFDATEQRPITQTDLVKATRCALGDLRFEFSGPTSLYLAVVPHSLTIQTGLDAGARIMVKGLATEHIQAQKVEPAGKADIPVTRGDGAISFNLSPLSHYEVRY